MIGGYHKIGITEEVVNLVDNNVDAINKRLGTHYTSFTLSKVSSQTGAGTNYFVHVTSNDGHKASVTFFAPQASSKEPGHLIDAHVDHVDPHLHDHDLSHEHSHH
jgi:hypothetical protein